MRWLCLSFLIAVIAVPARAEDIVDVLRRSQQRRLDALQPAPEGARTDAVRRSFAELRAAMPSDVAIDLHVVTGPTVAETLHGYIIVANQSLAEMPEGQRLFILAHELGHVLGGHWLQTGLVYTRWIPGEVTPERTDPVAGAMGRELSALAHRHEFEADAFALQALQRLGRTRQDAVAALMHGGARPDTATHPATRKRLMLLNTADSR